MTKWVEAVALPREIEETMINFLFEIFVWYGLPREVITDGRPQFVGHKIAATLKNHHIIHRITSLYHPQANGKVESTKKVIEVILMKTISSHR